MTAVLDLSAWWQALGSAIPLGALLRVRGRHRQLMASLTRLDPEGVNYMTTTAADVVGTAITGGVTSALEVITDNMPLVFGVAVAFVAWSVGRRVLGKI